MDGQSLGLEDASFRIRRIKTDSIARWFLVVLAQRLQNSSQFHRCPRCYRDRGFYRSLRGTRADLLALVKPLLYMS